MSRRCFNTFAEGSSSSSSEAESEEPGPAGLRKCLGDASALRPYCPCGKSLRRVAKMPSHVALLQCASTYDCCRCEDSILGGELHFRCRTCESVKVCHRCGPGVYIEHTFDIYDPVSREREVQEVPARVLHDRKVRRNRRRRPRGCSVGGFDAADEAALSLAREVVSNVKAVMAEVVASPKDLHDKDWEPDGLLERLLGADNQAQICGALRLLVPAVTRIFEQSPTLQVVKAPCKVFGDLHGQLRDLLLLFAEFGFPGSLECPSVIFNGDFVDRGKHQLEVLCVLFSLKLVLPSSVFLNRGNHEDPLMNAKYGFHRECVVTLGDDQCVELFGLISHAFSEMPLASLIEDKIFVVHGGIGEGKWSLDDLRKVRRPLTHAALQQDDNQWLWNLLWSDPIEDDERKSSSQIFGVHSSNRGKLAVKFGWNVTQAFCARNGLDLVIRSHQSKRRGLGFDVMHNESLMRVFSARDYEGHDNDSAILSVSSTSEADEASAGVLTVRPQVLSSLTRC